MKGLKYVEIYQIHYCIQCFGIINNIFYYLTWNVRTVSYSHDQQLFFVWPRRFFLKELVEYLLLPQSVRRLVFAKARRATGGVIS
jgi:hypothetical protein